MEAASPQGRLPLLHRQGVFHSQRSVCCFSTALHDPDAIINLSPVNLRQNQATGNQQWLGLPLGVSKCNRSGRTINSMP